MPKDFFDLFPGFSKERPTMIEQICLPCGEKHFGRGAKMNAQWDSGVCVMCKKRTYISDKINFKTF